MKRITLCISIVVTSYVMVLLNHCATQRPTSMQADQPKEIAETTLEFYYDEGNVIWWDEDTYSITMTCQLRNNEGSVAATQEMTWTVATVDEYSPDPIVEPFSLTWRFAEPPPPGRYVEYCMFESDGHYGRSDTEQDGNYWKMGEWRMPTCWGLYFKGQ